MRVARRMMRVLLAVGLAIVLVGLGLRTYLSRPAEDRLAPDEAVSIADLSRPLTRPSFLACPPSYCAAADMASPIFNMPWDQLREYWKESKHAIFPACVRSASSVRATRSNSESRSSTSPPARSKTASPIRKKLAIKLAKKGGKARAAKLSAKRRREIAQQAAQARWGTADK